MYLTLPASSEFPVFQQILSALTSALPGLPNSTSHLCICPLYLSNGLPISSHHASLVLTVQGQILKI